MPKEVPVHVTHQILLAVLDGTIPQQVLQEIVKEHLMALCPVCRQEIETFDWRQHRREVGDPSAYGEHFDRVVASVRGHAVQVQKERREAERWLADGRRRGRVAGAYKRFRGQMFAEILLEEAVRHVPADPEAVHTWADLAELVLGRTPSAALDPGTSPALLVRATAHRGNALRLLERPREAAAEFRAARKLVDERTVTDLSTLAELDSLEASLWTDQRHLARAERLLHRAALLYGLLGEDELRARTQIKLGLVHYDQGEPERAVRAHERALEGLTLDGAPRLYAHARFNLARALEVMGKPDQTLALLEEDREIQAVQLTCHELLRVDALRGKVAWATGKTAEAEKRLNRAREGFVAAGLGYETALVSLDLALVLLKKGETARVRTIAREALRIFGAQEVHPEAFAAFKLFHDAALAEHLTREVVEKTIRYIHAAQAKPVDPSSPS